jgi:type IV secretory pathway VirB2 component (pilin)
MKIKNKILILGLMLIVLVGLFGSAHWTYAQPVTQHCYNLDGTERTESTYEACLAAGGFWRAPTPPAGGGTPCTGKDASGADIPSGCTPAASKIYNLLAPLPDGSGGTMSTFDPTGAGGGALGGYLNLMIKLFIGICAVLAVIMIVMGGIQYMTSELPGNKEAGKERIMHAIFGLLLALGAWTLLNTINPDLLKTDLSSLADVTVEVTLADQIKSYTGQGACTPVADASNPCSVTSLANAGFTNATQASSICNGESKGTANLASGVDKGSDGNSFSFGLFQINVLAHANEIKDQNGNLVCSGIFTVDPNPPGKVGTSANDNTLGGCLQRNGTICVKYAATVTNQAKYQTCKDYITNPTNNIAYAAKLQTSRNWGQWGANASCHF